MTTAVRKTDAEQNLPTRLAYTIKEVALALGTNYWTVSRAVKAGEIPSFKVGGEYRINLFAIAGLIGIPPAELEVFLADVRAQSLDAETDLETSRPR